jgi:hypothetical protein
MTSAKKQKFSSKEEKASFSLRASTENKTRRETASIRLV